MQSALGSDPHVAVAILQQRADRVLREAVAAGDVLEMEAAQFGVNPARQQRSEQAGAQPQDGHDKPARWQRADSIWLGGW